MTISESPPPQLPVLQYATASPMFRSGRTLALVSAWLLAGNAIVALVSIGSTYAQVQLLESAKVAPLTPAQANANDVRQAAVAVVELFGFVLCAIFFLMWIHRATKNLSVFQTGLRPRFTPGWAVGYFFIPILNLFRPYQIVKELWIQSSSNPRYATAPALVGWWWALWIFSGFASRAAGRSSAGAEPSIESLVAASWMEIVASVLSLIAAVLCLQIVLRIERMQTDRALNVPASPPPLHFGNVL